MSYTITIVKTEVEETIAGKDWELTGKEDPGYAYTPEIIKRKAVERQIYQQIVAGLDLKKVIAAINNMQAEQEVKQ
jgi:hypothetical protein